VAVVVDQVIDQAIGSFTGLSSVEVLAALAVGTKVGLLGLLIAIPMAGCLKNSLDSWQPTTDIPRVLLKLLHSLMADDATLPEKRSLIIYFDLVNRVVCGEFITRFGHSKNKILNFLLEARRCQPQVLLVKAPVAQPQPKP